MSSMQVPEAFRDPAVAAQVNEKYQALLARSASDAAFRAKLLSDPRAAIAEFTGKDVSAIPETPTVKFIENTADATVVLPKWVGDSGELADSELEAVAGGTVIVITVTVLTTGITVGYLIAES